MEKLEKAEADYLHFFPLGGGDKPTDSGTVVWGRPQEQMKSLVLPFYKGRKRKSLSLIRGKGLK